VLPACVINQNMGNCYTGSVFAALLSVLAAEGEGLVGKRVFMFSYGSGSAASVYSFVGRAPTSTSSFSSSSSSSAATIPPFPFTLERMQAIPSILQRMEQREQCGLDDFAAALDMRAAKYGQAPVVPEGSLDHLVPGTFYVTGINEKHHREYARK